MAEYIPPPDPIPAPIPPVGPGPVPPLPDIVPPPPPSDTVPTCQQRWDALAARASAVNAKYAHTRTKLFALIDDVTRQYNEFVFNVACKYDFGRWKEGLNALYNQYIGWRTDTGGCIMAPVAGTCNQSDSKAILDAYEVDLGLKEVGTDAFYNEAARIDTAKGYFGQDWNPLCTEVLAVDGKIDPYPPT